MLDVAFRSLPFATLSYELAIPQLPVIYTADNKAGSLKESFNAYRFNH